MIDIVIGGYFIKSVEMSLKRLYHFRVLLVLAMLGSVIAGCGNHTSSVSEGKNYLSPAPQYDMEDAIINTDSSLPEGELQITITAGDTVLDALLFDNQTARDFAAMLPLTVELWHPAPAFARAFDLPERIPQYEEPGRTYELGSLAYWYEGPSVAVIYNASREETVVPVVPIGKITSDVNIFFDYGSTVTIALKEETEPE